MFTDQFIEIYVYAVAVLLLLRIYGQTKTSGQRIGSTIANIGSMYPYPQTKEVSLVILHQQ